MALSPAERSQRARHAALSVHARGRTNTGPARAAQLALLEQQVVAEALAQGENLSDDEVRKRVDFKRRARMAAMSRLAQKAYRVRRERMEGPA